LGKHPAYSGASYEMIFLGLAAKKFGISADKDRKRQEADDKSNKERIGGHGRRPVDEGDLPDVRDMSDKKFDKLERKVMRGGFNQ